MYQTLQTHYEDLWLVGEHLLDVLAGVGLGSLKRSTKSAVPNELSSDTERTRHAEQNSVELHLVKSVRSSHSHQK